MVYARIANRTVAEEYFAVSEKVEALYDAARPAPGAGSSHRPGTAPPARSSWWISILCRISRNRK
jgi:hypothetical protein